MTVVKLNEIYKPGILVCKARSTLAHNTGLKLTTGFYLMDLMTVNWYETRLDVDLVLKCRQGQSHHYTT